MGRRGLVAWGQPDEGYSPRKSYNPFSLLNGWVKAVKFFRWPGEPSLDPLLDWMRAMDKKRDWREIAEEKLEELEAISQELLAMGRWETGTPADKGGKQPFGSKLPISQRGIRFLVGGAEVSKIVMICRLRLEEASTVHERRQRERRALSEAIDVAAAAQRMAEWKERTKKAEKPSNGEQA